MSSDPRSDAPSPEADPSLIGERGLPLLEALEERIPGARKHADATASWALAIAVELKLDRETCLAVRETARLHEVGKVYSPAPLVSREEHELPPEDRSALDSHAEAGAQLALGADVPQEACRWINHWRERYEGGGGPEGLSGTAIPVGSRIIRVACAYDSALARSRAQSGTADPRAALAEAWSAAGAELDPEAVRALDAAITRSASASGA